MWPNLWHKAACGHLVQGLVHNMSGPLQILTMQLELLKLTQTRLESFLSAEGKEILAQQEERLSQIESQVERLRNILAAVTEVTQDSPGPVDLNEVLKKMLVLWEGDLKFKHEVEKEVHLSEEPLQIVAPPGDLMQGFSALFWALVPRAVEERRPFFVQTEKGPVVRLAVKGLSALPQDDPFLKAGREILSPYADFALEGGALALHFKS